MTALTLAMIVMVQSTAVQLDAADSAALLRSLRGEQERFERVRRDHLPLGDGNSADFCDETVGLWCFTHGDPNDMWRPPPEDSAVTLARDTLLARLSRAHGLLREDGWIAGQRVRYLVDAKRARSAEDAARQCRPAASWWCAALGGYAAHAAEHYDRAESAFDSALAAMDGKRRCAWRDISPLLGTAPSAFYRDRDCASRVDVEQAFWSLADPLLLISGNERRAEHFARRVQVEFETVAPSISPGTWSPAFAPWTIRYGWPAGWLRARQNSILSSGEPRVITEYPTPTQVFEPAWKLVEHPESLTAASLPLRFRGARTGYVPTYADRFDTLAYQVGIFRQSNMAPLIVAAYDFTSDSVPASAVVEAGLFVSGDRGPDYFARHHQQARGSVTLPALPQPGLLSLEVYSAALRRAGRVRYALPLAPVPIGRFHLSDLLLLVASDERPASLDEAMPLARGTTVIRQGETVGLYWEIYNADARVPVRVSLKLVRTDRGFLRKAAQALGLAGDDPPAISLQWEVIGTPGANLIPGTLALDLARHDPGRYTLHLEVTSRDRGTAGVHRELTIRR